MNEEINRSEMGKGPHVFGIRHLSPAGAWHLRSYLDCMRPQLVLIEGPSDFTELAVELAGKDVKPPVAVMAYTQDIPVHTILYPFAVYSPEYQAILWSVEHGCRCGFCDLPSGVILALETVSDRERQQEREAGRIDEEKTDLQSYTDSTAEVYSRLDELSDDGSRDSFWERTLEQAESYEGYRRGAALFGDSLRNLTSGCGKEDAMNCIREAYMRRQILAAEAEGIPLDQIVVVTGAFHVKGIQGEVPPLSDEELKALPCVESQKTLMPYSYYRLSERSGYGAGNKAPAYYELIWDGFCRQDQSYAAYRYLVEIAAYQRKNGMTVSSAEVIEAVRLSCTLADLHGSRIPVLKDLEDAAMTCMGHGRFGEIAVAVADTEIGIQIGSLPEGVSRTSIQMDFYHKLSELRLEKYKSAVAQDLMLDLREKLRTKSQKAALIDLERSFFLHRLRVLGIKFADWKKTDQDRATWAEHWVLQWTAEVEIQIVEAIMKGDTIEQAAAFHLKEQAENSHSMADIGGIMEDTFYCGMPDNVIHALKVLQAMAADAASIPEIARTADRLSVMIQYGDIRKLNREPLIPVLCQIFLRACLLLPEECYCDDQAAASLIEAADILNRVCISNEFLDQERFQRVLLDIAGRDDLNTRISGFAAALLLERGVMDSEELGREVERRLSKGIPAELGAGWFEGLSMRNHYALIARMILWEKLSGYLDTLDDDEFKRALVFLRRAFADFSSEEKNQIAENLGEIWQINPEQVSEVLNDVLPQEEQQLLDSLGDFDFDDI
ncbi:MAG: DUF5682 family protein [Lachnospiraceae bacterium]